VSLAEGARVVFEGIGSEDGLWPGDIATVFALGGRGAWVHLESGRQAGTLCLVLADDLVEYTPEGAEAP
jgi:hypothetical protein